MYLSVTCEDTAGFTRVTSDPVRDSCNSVVPMVTARWCQTTMRRRLRRAGSTTAWDPAARTATCRVAYSVTRESWAHNRLAADDD